MATGNKDRCPDLRDVSENGDVLFVGSVFSSAPYGSHVVMRELLKNFNPGSFWILAKECKGWEQGYKFEDRTLRLRGEGGVLGKIPYYGCVRSILSFFTVRRWCAARNLTAVIAVYPSIDLLPIAIILAHALKIPFYLYMHDTLCEALSKSKVIFLVRMLQHWAFSSAKRLFVMSDGIQFLYKERYGIDSVVIPHIYPEEVCADVSNPVSRTLFWAGGIYGINDHAFKRVVRVATRMRVKTVITAAGELAKNRILKWREEGLLVEPVFYNSRADYLAALKSHGALLLALNSPEESVFGKDELATIFSTKVPEYLASGRPIVLSCPDYYYLSRFFKTHQCGFVVNSSEEAVVEKTIEEALKWNENVRQTCLNAMEQAKRFNAFEIAKKFSCALSV